MIAQGLHNLSRRAKGPFVAFNCAPYRKIYWKANCSALKKGRLPGLGGAEKLV